MDHIGDLMSLRIKAILANYRDPEKLAYELAEYPLLRLLAFSRWFRLAFVAFVLFLFGFGLSLPKIWRATPAGFYPKIRVSGLDLLHAWTLKRGALEAIQAHRLNDALYAWQAAAAYNEADPELLRGLLQCLAIARSQNDYLALVLARGDWLLRLTQTNHSDLELVASLYEKYRLPELLLPKLLPMEDRLHPPLKAILLKCWFDAGYMDQYAAAWKTIDTTLKADKTLSLYQAAYQAGWGAPESRANGRTQLEAALTDPARQKVAAHLQLVVGLHLDDANRYAESLKRLAEWKEDFVQDHVKYWRLLARVGRKPEAVRLAQDNKMPPITPFDLIEQARVLSELDLREQASQLLQKEIGKFEYATGAWVVYGDLLMRDQRWDALGGLAVQIRQVSRVGDVLAAYSYYLEGRAELALHRTPLALTAFRKIPQHNFGNPNLALLVAKNLRRLGYGDIAKDLLAKLDREFGTNVDYWKQVFEVAIELKDQDLFYTAAQTLHKLRPDDWIGRNNYASALITLRRDPTEAIKLTMQLMAQRPNAAVAKINHSLALLQMQRAAEAQAVLDSLDPIRLSPVESTALHQARFELYFSRRDFKRALESSAQIDRQLLFPCERQWLDDALAQIAAPSNP